MRDDTTDGGLGQALQHKKTFEKHKFKAESEIYDELGDLYAEQEAAFASERMAAVKAAAQDAHAAFRVLEGWTGEKPMTFGATRVADFASRYFPAVYMLVITKCLDAYERRLEDDTDEARAERARYERLKASAGAAASGAIRDSAERFYERWLHHSGLEAAQEIAADVLNHVDTYIVLSAVYSIGDVRGPPELKAAELKESLPVQINFGFRFFYISFVELKAEGIVSRLNLGEMPFETLRMWAGVALLEGRLAASGGVEPARPRGPLKLAVDHVAFALARYFGGQAAPVGEWGGLARLPVKAPRGQKRELAIGEVLPPELLPAVDPESVAPTLERIRNERDETKAKVFVGTLALALQKGVDPGSFFVSVDDLVRLAAGHERTGRNKANNASYWAKAAEVVTYLALDLASTNVRVRVQLRHHPGPLDVEEYLMHRPRPVFEQGRLHTQFASRVVSLANTADEEELVAYLKSTGLKGFFLGFPAPILEALGTRTGKGQPNALEEVSREVMKLKGPAFWLAYDVAFLRRWARPEHATPRHGRPLLEALGKHGYLEKSKRRTGGRFAYKAALGSWLSDVDALVDINMLKRPGVSVYRHEKGDWQDVTRELKGWRSRRGVRITRDKLAELNVVYHLPRRRPKELAEPRADR